MLYSPKPNPNPGILIQGFIRKKLNRTKYVRNLGIKISENLNWRINIHDLDSKLNRANAVLAELWHFVNNVI